MTGTTHDRLVFGSGSVALLEQTVRAAPDARVLLVASPRALERAGLGHWSANPAVRVFSEFRPNPDLDDVLRGCAVRDTWLPTTIVGLGGGSAMDVAKLVRCLPTERTAALDELRAPTEDLTSNVEQLVLVPTTAGTGSEVTRFATVFDGNRKLSFDHELAAATSAVVDPGLATTCPQDVTSSCAMDALCHAVESLWARRSTGASRAAARLALRTLVPLLKTGLLDPSLRVREELASAALEAGRAINVSRTTAAHAFAYHLTRRFGVPHGVACLLNLQWLYAYNRDNVAGRCIDERGTDHVEEQLGHVAEVFDLSPDEIPEGLGKLLVVLGWSAQLRDYGLTRQDLPGCVEAGIGATARADNNPVGLHAPTVLDALGGIL
ncbi:alcohol dehydrogenase class IV [Streptacidiphilus sp. BW17]|uniref:phosphonoacetaldehyde reductase n=1 Tax=Streptacidiphilus sp. BW17 TaxID=3156274 RepID=UPI0035194237